MSLSFKTLVKRRVELSKHSSYSIGGPADYFTEPETLDALFFILTEAWKNSMPMTIFGLGSNILFPDQPEKGRLFVSLKRLIDIKFETNRVWLSAGVPLSFLSV